MKGRPNRHASSAPLEQRPLRIIFWRRIQGVGGLLLAVSFFLPAVDACNSNIVPAKEVWQFVTGGPVRSLGDWAITFLWFVAAYLFGLLTVVLAVRGYNVQREPGPGHGVAVALVLGAVVVIVLAAALLELWDDLSTGRGIGWDLGTTIVITLALVSLVYGLRGLRMGPAGVLCVRWYVAVLCVLWFGYYLVTEPTDTRVGLWLSIAGAVVIILGAFQEARTRTDWASRRTLLALLTCRLKLFDVDGPRCGSCDYLLIGLTVPRCPECGQAVDLGELTSAQPTRVTAGSTTMMQGDD